MTGWYVLYVRSCQERKVNALLQENNFETFLPMIKKVRKWSDRKKIIEAPLFPSYVFVKLQARHDFNRALSIKGACTYIRFGSEYARATNEEILRIKMLCGLTDVSEIKVTSAPIQIGEYKTIKFGPLEGLKCKIIRVDDNHKLRIRIESLRQNITATVPERCFYELGEIA